MSRRIPNPHLLAGASFLSNALLVALYLYSPLSGAAGYRLIIQVAAFPALVLTSTSLWLLPLVRFRSASARRFQS